MTLGKTSIRITTRAQDRLARAGRLRYADTKKRMLRVPGRQFWNARMIQVRHRSHATYSRQPRQVRKEATVTGSCVCSEFPVPGLFLRGFRSCDYEDLQDVYHSFRKKLLREHQLI